MRFEFFHYDPKSYDTFEWYQTVDMSSSLGASGWLVGWLPGPLSTQLRSKRWLQNYIVVGHASRDASRASCCPFFFFVRSLYCHTRAHNIISNS